MNDASICERCGWSLLGHLRSQYGLDCPTTSRPGFHRESTSRAFEVPQLSALDAVKVWSRESGGWTRSAERDYIEGYQDAQEAVRGLIRSHPDRLGEPQTLVVSHEELCGCVLDDCEFKKGWRAALRAQAKWGSA